MLSKYFALPDFTRSDTATRMGREVVVPDDLMTNGIRLANDLLDEVHMQVCLLRITSGYRPDWLNAAVGGSKVSAHMRFRAADVEDREDNMAPIEIARAIKKLDPIFLDKCILEFGGWVHLQVAELGATARRQYLTAVHRRDETVYLDGLVEIPT